LNELKSGDKYNSWGDGVVHELSTKFLRRLREVEEVEGVEGVEGG